MMYTFEVRQIVTIDSADLQVGNEAEARALLEQGYGNYNTDSIETVLVHVGHGFTWMWSEKELV